MDAIQLLEIARKEKPTVRYVTNRKRTAIGAWSETKKRYTAVAGLLLTGQWITMGDLLVDGQPCVSDWDETI